MKTLNDLARKDNAVMEILKVQELSHNIADTNHGTLTLKLVKGGIGKDYTYFLDAVPLLKEQQDELMAKFNGILYTL